MRSPSPFSERKMRSFEENSSNTNAFSNQRKILSNSNSDKCTNQKYKTLKSVTKSISSVYKIKSSSHKRLSNKKMLKSNSLSKKKHLSDKCTTLKVIATKRKYKTYSNDSNNPNLTSIKSTPELNKAYYRKINILTTWINWSKIKLLISKAKGTH